MDHPFSGALFQVKGMRVTRGCAEQRVEIPRECILFRQSSLVWHKKVELPFRTAFCSGFMTTNLTSSSWIKFLSCASLHFELRSSEKGDALKLNGQLNLICAISHPLSIEEPPRTIIHPAISTALHSEPLSGSY